MNIFGKWRISRIEDPDDFDIPIDTGPDDLDIDEGPDDFDIPETWSEYTPEFDRKTFVWTDKNYIKHKLKDIDNQYLKNIIVFLKRKIASTQDPDQFIFYLDAAVDFLEAEIKRRSLE